MCFKHARNNIFAITLQCMYHFAAYIIRIFLYDVGGFSNNSLEYSRIGYHMRCLSVSCQFSESVVVVTLLLVEYNREILRSLGNVLLRVKLN